MANNAHKYGFRWSYNTNGVPCPKGELMQVASGQNFNVSGDATNLNLNVGDAVAMTASGNLGLMGGNENAQTSQAGWGIVVGMGPVGFFNGTRMVRQTFLQSGCTYGSAIERISQVLVVPASAGIWEIDVDDNVTATTQAAYQAFIGENCDHRNTPNDAQLQVNPLLNIASHNPATATLAWRIRGISSNFQNQDFSGTFVKLLVSINKGQENYFTNVGI